jgi:hypothetical protein
MITIEDHEAGQWVGRATTGNDADRTASARPPRAGSTAPTDNAPTADSVAEADSAATTGSFAPAGSAASAGTAADRGRPAPAASPARGGIGTSPSFEPPGTRLFGEGPLARVTAPIYTFLIVDLLLLATALPALIPLVALDRDASNAPLAVVCALPVGPAFSAAFYALRRRGRDFTDLHPAAAFWRGYRMNLGGVLRLWVPWLAGMALIAVNLSHAEASAVPAWWRAALVVIAVAATLWMINALIITSLFAFRAVDVARLAAYFLGRTRGVTLGALGVLIAAVLVVEASSEAVLALFGVLFAAALSQISTPMTDLVEKDFTA